MELTVAVIQQPCQENKKDNLNYTESHLVQAANQKVQLVLLQELHTTPYFCQTENEANFDLAEPISGPTCKQLAKWAQQFNCVIVGSIFERRAAGLYHNTAVTFNPDGNLAGLYRKMHIPNDPGFHEKYYFTPGDAFPLTQSNSLQNNVTGFTPIETAVGKLGVLICWDQWFPEAARIMALQDAQLLLYPTAIGWIPQDETPQEMLDAWITVLRANAITNHLPALIANRVGYEPNPTQSNSGIEFWGHSMIINAQGKILNDCTKNQMEGSLLVANIQLRETEQLRKQWPFFRDRRIDAYHNLLSRYHK